MKKIIMSTLFCLCICIEVVDATNSNNIYEVWRILTINGKYDGTYSEFLGHLNNNSISANNLWNALLDCYDGTCESKLIYTNYVKFYTDIFGTPSKEIEANQVRDNVRVISYYYPLFQGVAYTGNNSIKSNWNAVASWLYASYGRSIYGDISEGYNFTTKGLQTTSTYRNGEQLVFSYNISFDFKNGRIKYTFTITDYWFDKKSNTAGTENFDELRTDKSFVINEIARNFNNYMSGLTSYLFNDNDW